MCSGSFIKVRSRRKSSVVTFLILDPGETAEVLNEAELVRREKQDNETSKVELELNGS